MMFCQTCIGVSDASQVGEVRREANRLASQAGLGDSDGGKASIIATELATNLFRYAPGGEVLLRSFAIGEAAGLEILAIDRGPGMTNVSRCLEDGYSSGGTAGNGLGAVRRLSTEFDIFSSRPGGTVVFARIGKSTTSLNPAAQFAWGVINRPAPHEIVCGDTWRIAQRNSELSLMVADGLGHGPQAAEAADAAAQAFEKEGFTSPVELLTAADRRLRGTRGAAVAFAHLDSRTGTLEFAGVGNIAGSVRLPQSNQGRGLVSHNGTVGVHMRKVQRFDYECPNDSLLILHSDGLQSRWSFDNYSGLTERHPAIVASVLYRDYCRGRDDVTVCVIRCPPSTAA